MQIMKCHSCHREAPLDQDGFCEWCGPNSLLPERRIGQSKIDYELEILANKAQGVPGRASFMYEVWADPPQLLAADGPSIKFHAHEVEFWIVKLFVNDVAAYEIKPVGTGKPLYIRSYLRSGILENPEPLVLYTGGVVDDIELRLVSGADSVTSYIVYALTGLAPRDFL